MRNILLKGALLSSTLMPTNAEAQNPELPRLSTAVIAQQERDREEIARILRVPPAERAATVRAIVESAPDTYDGDIALLSHGVSDVRDIALQRIVSRATAEVEVSRGKFEGTEMLEKVIQANGTSAEMKSRLRRALFRIQREEIRVDLQTASIFTPPEKWQEPDHTENMSEILRTIGAERTPICIKNSPFSILTQWMKTGDMKGGEYWPTLLSLRLPDGSQLMVNANSSGHHYIQKDTADDAKYWSSSGAMCAFAKLNDSWPHRVIIRFDTEPRFRPTSSGVLKAVAIQQDGKEIDLKVDNGETGSAVMLPKATKEGEEVTLHIEGSVGVIPIRAYEVADLTKAQEFTVKAGNSIPYKVTFIETGKAPLERSHWTTFTIDPPDLDVSLRKDIGFSFIGEDGISMTSNDIDEPIAANGGRWILNTMGKPHRIVVHAPDNITSGARGTFTFKNIPLSTKPEIR